MLTLTILHVLWSNSGNLVQAKRNSKVKILILSIFDAVPVKLNLFQMVFSGSGSHRVLFLMGQVEFSIYQCFTPIDAEFLEGLMQIQSKRPLF